MKTGDILTAQWGYEQTNITFYVVLDATEKTAKIQEIGKEKTRTDSMEGYAMPKPSQLVGKPIRRKISPFEGVEEIKVQSYMWARPWDGRPEHFTEYA